ncbi:hypothetical protein ACIBRY_35685 [Streptomyces anulatus]
MGVAPAGELVGGVHQRFGQQIEVAMSGRVLVHLTPRSLSVGTLPVGSRAVPSSVFLGLIAAPGDHRRGQPSRQQPQAARSIPR